MRLPRHLRARDAEAAARASVVVQAASAAVIAAAAVLDPVNATVAGQLACWTVVALLSAGVVACRRVPARTLDEVGVLLLIPLLGAVAVNLTNLVTSDTSAAAQVFLVMPVLLGAAKLRDTAAALVTGVAVLGNLGVTLSLADPVRALTDSVFTGAALVTVTVVLSRAALRRDDLLDLVQRQARTDALTGLANRGVLDEALAGTRGEGAGTALVLVDVDAFKTINDLHGHPAGDAALRHLAEVLTRTVRCSDSVAGRLGGDELAVLLTDCPLDVAVGRAGDLLAAVRAESLVLTDGTELELSVSIGVAHVVGDADARSLYSAADRALYRAKQGGRNQLALDGA